jgi:deoxyxylulose-5-phosphate synthase
MRYKFAELLEQAMEKNKDIFFLTGDLGYKIFDNILEKYPDRAYTVGASEQLMMGMAVGLADSGKLPFVYSITPFLLYRPFEIIRNYVNHENCNVKMVGCGRDNECLKQSTTSFLKSHLKKLIQKNWRILRHTWYVAICRSMEILNMWITQTIR